MPDASIPRMADTSDDAEPAGRCALRLARVDATLIALVLILSGAGSVWLGQDLNFDLLSYHYYNGYAFVEGRLDRDIAPTGWHTYISPAMDALSYVGMVALPPRVFGFLFGALHGLNVALVYLLALALLTPGKPRQVRFLAGLAALVSAVGPNAASELGTTMGNNLVSIPVLGALLALLWPLRDGRSPLAAGSWTHARLLAAATLCGVASGLRLTAAVDHLALCLVALLFTARERSIRTFLTAASVLGVGSLLGFLAVNGLWSARLLERFGNPLFPFANQVFRSGYFEPEFLRDTRWVAREAWDYLRPPLDIALGRMERLQEIGARDARYLVLVVVAIAVVVLALARRLRGSAVVRAGSPESFVLAYFFLRVRALGGGLLLLPLHDHARVRGAARPAGAAASPRAGEGTRSGRPDGEPRDRRVVPHRFVGAGRMAGELVRPHAARTRQPARGVRVADRRRRSHSRCPTSRGMRASPTSRRSARRAARSSSTRRSPRRSGSTGDRSCCFRASGWIGTRRIPRSAARAGFTTPRRTRARVAERFGLALTDRCEDMRTRRGPLYLCEVERKVP